MSVLLRALVFNLASSPLILRSLMGGLTRGFDPQERESYVVHFNKPYILFQQEYTINNLKIINTAVIDM